MSEWMISINNNFSSRPEFSSRIQFLFGIETDKARQQWGLLVHRGRPNVRSREKYKLEKIFNGHTYSLATLAIKTAFKKKSQTSARRYKNARSRPRGYHQAQDWHVTRDRPRCLRLNKRMGPIIRPSLTHEGTLDAGTGPGSRLPQHCRDAPDIRHRRRRERRRRRG